MSKVVYVAYEFNNDIPFVLGIFTSESVCKKHLTEGNCYCAIPLNFVFKENITPLYIYKIGKNYLPYTEIAKQKGIKL